MKASLQDQRDGLLPIERPAGLGRGNLTDTVSDDAGRDDAAARHYGP